MTQKKTKKKKKKEREYVRVPSFTSQIETKYQTFMGNEEKKDMQET